MMANFYHEEHKGFTGHKEKISLLRELSVFTS
jgi:hypothetical protein